jgi:hypothetical protein
MLTFAPAVTGVGRSPEVSVGWTRIVGGQTPKGEIRVKKLLAILVLAAAGFAVWRKIEAGKAERTDWAGATDPVR